MKTEGSNMDPSMLNYATLIPSFDTALSLLGSEEASLSLLVLAVLLKFYSTHCYSPLPGFYAEMTFLYCFCMSG